VSVSVSVQGEMLKASYEAMKQELASANVQ
jgi:hypothetical protein